VAGVTLITAMWRTTLLALALVALTVQPNSSMAAAPAAKGDAARGEKLFSTLPCVSCHDITKPWPGGDICPNLGNVATEAARIVRAADYHGRGKDAAGYLRESIVDPNAFLVPGENYRQPDGQSVMPKDFARTLSPSALDDLVAFLHTLR